MQDCMANGTMQACGFKIMFNAFDNRISDDVLDYMLRTLSSKVVCLTRRNVYEQTLSSMFKKHYKCVHHEKHGHDDCKTADNFTIKDKVVASIVGVVVVVVCTAGRWLVGWLIG